MGRSIIKSTKIYTENRIVSGGLLIEDGKIAAIFEGDVTQADCPIADYGDMRVIPGVIELKNHGYLGWNATSGDEADVRGYVKALTAAGITGVLPAGRPGGNLAPIARVMDTPYEGTRILGIHCFGPFLNEARLPGGMGSYEGTATRAMAEAFYEETDGKMRLMTLAPEIDGIIDVINFCKEKGVKIAMGHTSATYDETMWGIANGCGSFTHICNQTMPIHHRDIGATGAGLMSDVYCELICDLYHVSVPMLELIFKLKPKNRIMLSPDNNSLSGMPPGVYASSYGPDRTTTCGEDGLFRLDNGRIAGSSMCNLDCIRHCVENLDIPLEETIKMSALTAATYIGINDKKGSIAVGKDADIVVISDDYAAQATYVEGTLCYTPDMREGLINPNGPKPLAG